MTVNMYEELVNLIDMLVPEVVILTQSPHIIIDGITATDLDALCMLFSEKHKHYCISTKRCFSGNTGLILKDCYSLYPYHYLNAVQMEAQWQDFITYYK